MKSYALDDDENSGSKAQGDKRSRPHQTAIDRLIAALQQAQRAGFSSLSSPVDILLEAFIESALALAFALKEGRPAKRASTFFFSKMDVVDELGNPIIKTGLEESVSIKDRKLSKIFTELARFGVAIKNQEPIKHSFMRCLEGIGFDFLQQGIAEMEASKKKQPQRKTKYPVKSSQSLVDFRISQAMAEEAIAREKKIDQAMKNNKARKRAAYWRRQKK